MLEGVTKRPVNNIGINDLASDEHREFASVRSESLLG